MPVLIALIILILILFFTIKWKIVDPIRNEKKFNNAVYGALRGEFSGFMYLSFAFATPSIHMCRTLKRYAGKSGFSNMDANKVRSIVFDVWKNYDENSGTFSYYNSRNDEETIDLAKELILTTYEQYDDPIEAREALVNLVLSHKFSS